MRIAAFALMLGLFAPLPLTAATDGPAPAPVLPDATAALAKRDWETARKQLLARGQAGDAEAWFRLGQLEENGFGAVANATAAWGAWRRAADLGHGESTLGVARAYEIGVGVPMNLTKAAEWYDRAAKLGQIRAKTRLAMLLIDRRAKLERYVDPMPLLIEAADAGDAEALSALDRLAVTGRFDLRNLGEAGPDDEAAQQALSEVAQLLAPLQRRGALPRLAMSGEPFVARRGEDVHVVLPNVRLIGRQGEMRLGTLRLAVSGQGDARTARLMLPATAALVARKGAPRLSLRLEAASITGQWSGDGLAAVQSDLRNVTLTAAQGASLSVNRLTAGRSLRQGQMAEQMEAERLSSGALVFDRLALRTGWRAKKGRSLFLGLPVGEPGPAALLSLYQLPQSLGTILAPLAVSADGALGELAGDDGGLAAGLLEANADLGIEEFAIEAGGVEVSASGAFKAAPGGLIGALDLMVYQGKGEAGPLAALAGQGRSGKDGLGREVSIIPAMLMPGGGLMLNGEDASGLLGR